MELPDPGSKEDLLGQIATERAALDALVGRLTPAQMQEAVFEGDRSVKDILAHIIGWEQRMIGWVRESYDGKTPDRPAPGQAWEDLDELNQAIFEEHRDRPLAVVLTESASSYQDALECAQEMSEAELFDGDRFAWRVGHPMWPMIAGNTSWHYREHRQQIEGRFHS